MRIRTLLPLIALVTGALPPRPAAASLPGDSALVFPVAHRGLRDVVGRMGDPRDGGRRRHRGVDIAAPRGTAVLAVASGTIHQVAVTPIGGRIVWLREDGSGRLHYYAHLDRVMVRPGEKVSAGERIGTVGNTGNASTTAPHLHYSVHENGFVVDPLRVLGGRAPAAAPRLARGGRWARTRLNGAALKSSSRGGFTLATLPVHEQVEVLGNAGRFARVRYRGRIGYIARWLLE